MGLRRCFCAGSANRFGRRCARERLVDVGVWHVDHHADESEPEGLGCGSAGSCQLDGADGRGLRLAVDPVAERAPVEAVLGALLGERLLRGAPGGEQLGGFGLGDAARGAGMVKSGRQGHGLLVGVDPPVLRGLHGRQGGGQIVTEGSHSGWPRPEPDPWPECVVVAHRGA